MLTVSDRRLFQRIALAALERLPAGVRRELTFLRAVAVLVDDPAMTAEFRWASRRVLVGWPFARRLTPAAVQCLLAHEFGHAYLYAIGDPDYDDEDRVDVLARSWGFEMDVLRQQAHAMAELVLQRGSTHERVCSAAYE
jgi:hypothetical protein